jgi:hypothetical protein
MKAAEELRLQVDDLTKSKGEVESLLSEKTRYCLGLEREL